MSKPQLPTIDAVVEEARRLRERADRQMLADPYAKPYRPSEAAARQLCKMKCKEFELGLAVEATPDEVVEARLQGPGAAIAELGFRAARRDREYEAERVESDRSLERLARRHKRAARDVEEQRRLLSPGQRIDAALAGLAVVAAAAGSGGFDPKVHGGEGFGLPKFPGDPSAAAREVALVAARRVELELDRARRRQVEAA